MDREMLTPEEIRSARQKSHTFSVSAEGLINYICNSHELLRARLDAAEQERDKLKADYYDLIMKVGNKVPNESRHETARRYIQQAELRDYDKAKSSVPAPPVDRKETP